MISYGRQLGDRVGKSTQYFPAHSPHFIFWHTSSPSIPPMYLSHHFNQTSTILHLFGNVLTTLFVTLSDLSHLSRCISEGVKLWLDIYWRFGTDTFHQLSEIKDFYNAQNITCKSLTCKTLAIKWLIWHLAEAIIHTVVHSTYYRYSAFRTIWDYVSFSRTM